MIEVPIDKLNNNGDIIETYSSLKDAARLNKRANSAIHQAIKLNLKSAGFHWKYKNDNVNIQKKVYGKSE